MAEAVKLSAAQRSKIRRLSQPKELAPDEEGGELNIVPFLDIVVNILIFVLSTVAVTFTATIETQPLRADHERGPRHQDLERQRGPGL
jgi:biopolymer transport protein TolR